MPRKHRTRRANICKQRSRFYDRTCGYRIVEKYRMSRDLSQYNMPIGELFSSELSDEAYSLICEQLDFFEANGYIAGVRVLDSRQIGKLRDELSRLMKPEQATDPRF